VFRLRELKKRDEEKLKLEKAQNELESFIIGSQEKLYEELWQQCSTEAEREDITAKLSAASDWLYEVDENTPRKVGDHKWQTGGVLEGYCRKGGAVG
jgi:hypoxia up-regulated 1